MMTEADYYSLERIFKQGKWFWAGRDYRQALECFLKVIQQSEGEDWRRQIAEFTGGAFQIKKLAMGKKPLLSPDDKQIVFVSKEKDGGKVFLVDCNGENVCRLSQFVSSDIEFQFFPDGRHLIFVSQQGGKSQLDIVKLENGEKKCLAQYEGIIQNPVFSPDGKRIAFSCGKFHQASVHLLDIESGKEIELISRKKCSFAPVFSPDGRKIIFIRYQGKVWKRFFLAIEDIVTGKHIFLKAPSSADPSLRCSPDSSYVAFGSAQGFHLFSLDGKVKRRIAFNGSCRRAWSPSFSGDGKYVVFVSGRDKRNEIQMLEVDAMKVNIIFDSKIPLRWVTFLPGGRRIMCAYRHGRFTHRLFLINPDGSGLTSLDTDIPCASRSVRGVRNVSFSSDGKKVVYAYDQDGDYRKPEQICLMEIEPLNPAGHEEFALRLGKLLAQEKIAAKQAELTFKTIKELAKELSGQISQENLKEYVQRLQDFGPRRSGSNACKRAAEFLYEKFSGWGLEVRYDNYRHPRSGRFNSRNVIATLPGKTNPEIIYIISAHYDSHEKSPGIWDDACGVAVVLETARALSKCHLGATLKFICFSGEEMQNIGSTHFVREAKENNLDIRGMLDIDCIGYQVGDKMEATLFYTSVPLRDLLHSASLFCSDLLTYSSASPERCGVLPFVKEFGDITVSIQDYPYLPHPYMHDAGDVIGLLSFPLITEVAKLSAVALTAMAICPSPVKGIKIEHVGKNRGLLISWQKNSEEDIEGYRLYHGPYPDIFERVVDAGQTDHCCLEDLPIGQDYFIAVRAYSKGGYESWEVDTFNINNPH